MIYSRATSILLFILISTMLINNDLHVSPYGFSYYTHNIIAAVLVAYSGLFLASRRQVIVRYASPMFFLVLYVLFYALQGYFFVHNAFNSGHVFLLIGMFVFAGYCILHGMGNLNALHLGRIISLLVCVEMIYCFLQYAKIVESKDALFAVSGSLPNPNQTAMFLAMAFPFVLYGAFSDKSWFRIVSISAIPLCLFALVLLQCRSAAIGCFVGTAYFLCTRYGWRTKMLQWGRSSNRVRLGVFSMAFLGLVLFAAHSIYNLKTASSESRVMIWKISAGLGMEKPIMGHGLFMFDKAYNLAQAAYFKSGQATETEVFNSSYIRIAYNDYVQNFVEGGFLGLLLFAGFIGSLLAMGLSKNKKKPAFHAAYSGVLVFFIMSLFNSAEYDIPVFCLLMLYAAIVCSSGQVPERAIVLGQRVKMLVATVLVFVGCCFLFSQARMCKASMRMKAASELSKEGKDKEAVSLLKPMRKVLSLSNEFWYTGGAALHNMKKYGLALEKFKMATKYTSNPDVFLRMGACYFQLGKYDEAIEASSLASNIVPNRIYPRLALMRIYMAQKDTLNTVKTANEIIRQQPKGLSKDAEMYKKSAQDVLNTWAK